MSEMTGKRKRPGSRKQSRTQHYVEDRPNPMAQVGFSGSRHLIPERIPSARREQTVGLRVIDLNQETVNNLKLLSPTLRRLDLSSLHLVRLTDEFVACLERIERLDMSYNDLNDEAFPPNFQKLKHLHDLDLHYNKLTSLPKGVKRLKDLTRLKIGNNKLYTTEGLERLKKLQILMLESNSIESMPREVFTNLRKLEIFHCAHNSIKDIPADIRYLRHLKDLDLAGNKLISLPPELFLLPRLEVLNASNNRISRVPTINIKGRLNRKLVSIDLSDNTVVKFPEHLLFMTEKLDLCRNKIKSIPLSVLKKMDPGTGQELLISHNPLVNPPLDVADCGIRSIVQYFQEAKADIKVYQGIKVLVVGASGSGKTSLIQSLVDQQARVTAPGETTVGVDMYDIDHDVQVPSEAGAHESKDKKKHTKADESEHEGMSSKSMQISLWDFSGHPQYLFPHYFFLHDPALIILTFNMATYSDRHFAHTIGSWLDWIITKTNKLVLLPVGTMADAVSPGKAAEICESVLHLIDIHMKNYKESIEREIQKIEAMPHISTVLSDQLKAYIHLLKAQIFVSDKVVTVSAQEYTGMDTLLSTIEKMALNDEIFPHVLRVIPCLWSEVENYVEDRGWAMQVPYMHWDAYCEEVTKKFGMKHLLHQITQYLHDTGKVIWYADNQYLKNYVFLRPSWLSDVMKQMFRHNVVDIDYHMEESFKQNNILLEKFNKIISQITEEGIIDREFLRGAWSALLNAESTKSIVEVIVVLLEFFEIGYPFVKPGNKQISMSGPIGVQRRKSRAHLQHKLSTMSTVSIASNPSTDMLQSRPQSSSKERPGSRSMRSESLAGLEEEEKKKSKKNDEPELPKITKVVIPWIRNLDTPEAFVQDYTEREANPALVALYKFPRYAPPGFFETMCVRALKEQLSFAVLHNWQDNMYAQNLDKPYRLRLERDIEGDATYMRVELRHDDVLADDKEVESMWSVLLPYLREVEQLLTHFHGARVERLIECPKCSYRGFLGEWLSPKDLQGSTFRTCENCHENVATCYLIQPKEKKRVEEFLLRKLKREQEKRQTETENQACEHNVDEATQPSTPNQTHAPAQPETDTVFQPDLDPETGIARSPIFCDSRIEPGGESEGEQEDAVRRDVNDIDLDFDEEQFLQELQANSMGAYIYDSASDKGKKQRKQTRVTAVQTDF